LIHELALIDVIPGKEADFEAAVQQAVPLFKRAAGCKSMKLHRTIEHPARYYLKVEWDTLEDHTVGFRQSDDFQEWRRLVSPFFQKPPEVIHTEVVLG
jgi:heme-degrading monooxygenase HmoA